MPDVLEIRPDPRQLAELQRDFAAFPRAFPKIVLRALNRVGRTMRRDTIRIVQGALKPRLTQKRIRTRVLAIRASRHRWRAGAKAGRFGFPLGWFKPVQMRSGVLACMREVPGAFIVHLATGHTLVARRAGVKAARGLPGMRGGERWQGRGRRRRTDRTGLKEQYGPTAAAVVRAASQTPGVLSRGRDTLRKRLAAEALLILTGKRRA